MVFLDRDGTINVERHHLASVEGMELLPGAADGIRLLNQIGCLVVVISNQPVVARGGCSLETLEAINRRMVELLASEGASLDAIYVCPHSPEDGCTCRKPKTGLIERGRRAYGNEVGRSFVVGDKCSDIQAGLNSGATTLLVRTGHGRDTESSGECKPEYVVDNLKVAAEQICGIIQRTHDFAPGSPETSR
jgi:D-glycero-D-manno-heptose 1,7-bisphosphate phosphatase